MDPVVEQWRAQEEAAEGARANTSFLDRLAGRAAATLGNVRGGVGAIDLSASFEVAREDIGLLIELIQKDISSNEKGVLGTVLYGTGVPMLAGAYDKLREEDWPRLMESEEATGNWTVAQLLSVLRVVMTPIIDGVRTATGPNGVLTAVDAANLLTDGLDGPFVRKTKRKIGLIDPETGLFLEENPAETEIGKGGDQLSDKYTMMTKELFMVINGDLSMGDFVARFARDYSVTLVRELAIKEGADAAAARSYKGGLAKLLTSGKSSTFFRMFTDWLLQSKAGHELPKRARSAMAHAATGLTVFTGGATIAGSLHKVKELRQGGAQQEEKGEPIKVPGWRDDMEPAAETRHFVIDDISSIDAEGLKEAGCEMVIVDVDNTLIDFDAPKEEFWRWKDRLGKLVELRAVGIKIVIASNTKNVNRLLNLREYIEEVGQEYVATGELSPDTKVISSMFVPESTARQLNEHKSGRIFRRLQIECQRKGFGLYAGKSKPSPEYSYLACQVEGIDPTRAVAIGDQFKDRTFADGMLGGQILVQQSGRAHRGVAVQTRIMGGLWRARNSYPLRMRDFPRQLTEVSKGTWQSWLDHVPNVSRIGEIASRAGLELAKKYIDPRLRQGQAQAGIESE